MMQAGQAGRSGSVNKRQATIRVAFMRYQQSQRISRWAMIDDILVGEGLDELTSAERDEVDLAAATGCVPFDQCPPASLIPMHQQPAAADDLADLLRGRGCERCD
jgi:hypothetical protein